MKHTFYFKVLEMCACCVRQFENLPSTMGRFLRLCLKEKKVDLSGILLILATVFYALWEFGNQEVRCSVSYCLIYLINPNGNILKFLSLKLCLLMVHLILCQIVLNTNYKYFGFVGAFLIECLVEFCSY